MSFRQLNVSKCSLSALSHIWDVFRLAAALENVHFGRDVADVLPVKYE